MPLYACQTAFCQTRATDGKPGGRDGLAQRVMPTHRGPVYGGQARTFSLTACLALFPMHVAAIPCCVLGWHIDGGDMVQGQPPRARLIQNAGMFGAPPLRGFGSSR